MNPGEKFAEIVNKQILDLICNFTHTDSNWDWCTWP